jgi:serine O-acetyltransferase
MAIAPERDGIASFLQQLARQREDYALPPRLRELAERFIHRTLELLFPHFAAEGGGRAGAVADGFASLRTLLVDALRLPEAHCGDPDAVVERFFSALPDVRATLLLDAQAICDGDPCRTFRRRSDPRLPRFLRHRRLPARAPTPRL